MKEKVKGEYFFTVPTWTHEPYLLHPTQALPKLNLFFHVATA